MKLLLLTPQSPFPPRQGTTLRNYYLLRHFAANHEVHLFSCLAPSDNHQPDPQLLQLCARVESFRQPERSPGRRLQDSLLAGKPDMALRLVQDHAHSILQKMLAEESYDLVQIEGIEMAPYGFQILQTVGPKPPVVFDNHNVEFLLQKRAAVMDARRPARWHAACYSLLQWQKLHRYERAFCQAVDGIVAVSELDRQALVSLAPRRPIVNVPNGVDIARYVLQPLPTASPPTLVFTGKMDYRPNVDAMLWFGLQVLPRIRRQMAVRLQIAGMSPHPRLDRLRALPNVELTGAVEDIVPYIHGSAIYLTPMRVGGGTRFKVLEAMACARPIVSTSLGVEGIPVRDGEHVLIADDARSFADAVLSLLHDQAAGGERSRALGEAARSFVEKRFSWDTILPQLDAFHAQLL